MHCVTSQACSFEFVLIILYLTYVKGIMLLCLIFFNRMGDVDISLRGKQSDGMKRQQSFIGVVHVIKMP